MIVKMFIIFYNAYVHDILHCICSWYIAYFHDILQWTSSWYITLHMFMTSVFCVIRHEWIVLVTSLGLVWLYLGLLLVKMMWCKHQWTQSYMSVLQIVPPSVFLPLPPSISFIHIMRVCISSVFLTRTNVIGIFEILFSDILNFYLRFILLLIVLLEYRWFLFWFIAKL